MVVILDILVIIFPLFISAIIDHFIKLLILFIVFLFINSSSLLHNSILGRYDFNRWFHLLSHHLNVLLTTGTHSLVLEQTLRYSYSCIRFLLYASLLTSGEHVHLLRVVGEIDSHISG